MKCIVQHEHSTRLLDQKESYVNQDGDFMLHVHWSSGLTALSSAVSFNQTRVGLMTPYARIIQSKLKIEQCDVINSTRVELKPTVLESTIMLCYMLYSIIHVQ
jgi:hypothetical protein